MNCWKTVNLSREYGTNRICLVSLLIGVLSFIFLYLAFSLSHQAGAFEDHGLLPLLAGIAVLPTAHKLVHIISLIIVKKRVKLNWKRKYGLLPSVSLPARAQMSKPTLFVILLAPTICLTIPGIIFSYMFDGYFIYFLIFTAVNIGYSCTDFLYINQMLKAPKRCLIENARDGYDILI